MKRSNIRSNNWGEEPEGTLFSNDSGGTATGPQTPEQKLATQNTACDYDYRINRVVSDMKGWSNCRAQAQTAYLANVAAAAKDLQTAVAAEAVGGNNASAAAIIAAATGQSGSGSSQQASATGAGTGSGASAASGTGVDAGSGNSSTIFIVLALVLLLGGGFVWYRKNQAAKMAALTPPQ